MTVCPRLSIDVQGDKRLGFGLNQRYRYEKHTTKRIFYEYEEVVKEFQDERKFGNISYTDFLNRIEDGSIKPQQLGDKL